MYFNKLTHHPRHIQNNLSLKSMMSQMLLFERMSLFMSNAACKTSFQSSTGQFQHIKESCCEWLDAGRRAKIDCSYRIQSLLDNKDT
jgi:hypothetical protein